MVRRRSTGDLIFQVAASSPNREFELSPYSQAVHERYNLYWQLDG